MSGIDGYRLGPDHTDRDGHVYSDKAPGQEVLAVPAYLGARLVGADPARTGRIEGNLSLWWVTLWSAGLPGVGIILLVAVAAHRRGTPIPPPALATLAFGTLLLPFSINLYGHLLGALLGFGAWLVIDRRPASLGPRRGSLAAWWVWPCSSSTSSPSSGLFSWACSWFAGTGKAVAYVAAGLPSAACSRRTRWRPSAHPSRRATGAKTPTRGPRSS